MQRLLVDAHLDLAWNALQWNRDITQSVYTLRTQEAGQTGKGRAQNTVALPEMRQGGVGLCFATLMGRSTGIPVHHVDFHSPEQAYAIARGHLAYYRALEQRGQVRLITDLPTLERHVDSWATALAQPGADIPSLPIGMVISMESADAILEPSQVQDWWQTGVRLIGPAHFGPGRYAGGTGVEHGLTERGFALLDEMQRHGIILDVTHLTDKGFWQALERFDGHVIASHTNSRRLVPHQRQFDDRQIQAVIARNGVIGVALDCWMLEPGWVKGVSVNRNVSLAAVADHIDAICQIAGDAHHVGIGSDLDGGYGREQSPHDLDTIADLRRLDSLLADRGYAASDIEAVFSGNWLRKLKEAWQ
ncbi:MAG: membrane dipeptidase [Chloroflexi bacterium]|nr:membrane dipeptidase [Chloroflexota bacterium]